MRYAFPLALLLPAVALAQPKIPATYPTLTSPASLGGKPGTTVDVALPGTNLLDATAIWTSFNGKATIADGQKDPAKLTAKIDIPAATAPGLYAIRVATKAG